MLSLDHIERQAVLTPPKAKLVPTDTAEVVTLRAELPLTEPRTPTRRLRAAWADAITITVPEPGLVADVLPSEGLSVLYGASNSGKTAAVIDLACRVAIGLQWHGKEVQEGVVLYVAAEAPASVERRAVAWARFHGRTPDRLLIVGQSVDLAGDADVQALIALAEEAKERGPVRLIVLDTLARVTPGADENSSRDMGRFVANLDALAHGTGAHVLTIHHTGKDPTRGARGSSAIRCAVDAELECEAGVLTVTKSRDGLNGLRFGFQIQGVPYLPEHPELTAAVAVASEMAPTAPSAPRPLPARQKIALDVLNRAICDHGRELPAGGDIPPRTKGVSYEQARQLYLRYEPGGTVADQPKRDKGHFKNALQQLQARGLVRCVNDMLWVAPHAPICPKPAPRGA